MARCGTPMRSTRGYIPRFGMASCALSRYTLKSIEPTCTRCRWTDTASSSLWTCCHCGRLPRGSWAAAIVMGSMVKLAGAHDDEADLISVASRGFELSVHHDVTEMIALTLTVLQGAVTFAPGWLCFARHTDSGWKWHPIGNGLRSS